MKNFFGGISDSIAYLVRSMKVSERMAFFFFLLLAIASFFTYLYSVNAKLLVEIPRSGGSITEGFVGSPRFINPVLATTDVDKDLSSLVYSGLMRYSAEGELLPDLAESYKLSEDGLTYVFTLRDDAKFHDGSKVTSADILFTIEKVQDPGVKSPKRALFDGVVLTAISEREVQFVLPQPYASFVSNTTIGILPSHLWQSVSAENFPFSNLNQRPIGSGPYEVRDLSIDKNGLVTLMDFSRFNQFVLGKPYIKSITARFFDSEDARLAAWENREIDSAGAIPKERTASYSAVGKSVMHESPLHKIFGVFFNQNQSPVLLHSEIRKALNQAVDKESLIEEILGGHGSVIDSPIPLFSSLKQAGTTTETVIDTKAILETLAKDGWQKNNDGILEKKTKTGSEKLIFSIYTSDNEDLKATAKRVSEMWNQIGAIVDVKVFEGAQFNLGVIRPRKYDALLFGITVGRDMDYYSFWHSSQRNDPGLNIALYTNPKADKLLLSARTLSNAPERQASEQAFALEVMRDIPAVFLYSPHFIYAQSANIKGYKAESLRTPGDRFYDIYKWYIEIDNVWSVFSK